MLYKNKKCNIKTVFFLSTLRSCSNNYFCAIFVRLFIHPKAHNFSAYSYSDDYICLSVDKADKVCKSVTSRNKAALEQRR